MEEDVVTGIFLPNVREQERRAKKPRSKLAIFPPFPASPC